MSRPTFRTVFYPHSCSVDVTLSIIPLGDTAGTITKAPFRPATQITETADGGHLEHGSTGWLRRSNALFPPLGSTMGLPRALAPAEPLGNPTRKSSIAPNAPFVGSKQSFLSQVAQSFVVFVVAARSGPFLSAVPFRKCVRSRRRNSKNFRSVRNEILSAEVFCNLLFAETLLNVFEYRKDCVRR